MATSCGFESHRPHQNCRLKAGSLLERHLLSRSSMFLFLFDLGGTLINDPFADALAILRKSTRPYDVGLPGFAEEAFDLFLETWTRENALYNFPLASHFL